MYARPDDSFVCPATFARVHKSVVIFISLQCGPLKRIVERMQSHQLAAISELGIF